ncbi:MAG: glycosyltransferase [Bacilli bacterium]|jgi:glycosyltransferase involved in cell wall biosynthesis
MNKMLYVASLPADGHSFDGERNKSKAILSCFKKVGTYDIDIIDYTKNKYLQTIKLILKAILCKYDLIFISKCIVGGTIALHQILKFGKAQNKKNIVFYLVGNGYSGFENKKMYLGDIKKCRKVILESEKVIPQMKTIGVDTDLIFPSIKDDFAYPLLTKEYKHDDVLHALFFSRIHVHKGVLDAVQAIVNVNSQAGKTLYTFDISGGKYTEPEYQETENKILEEIKIHPEIRYLGTSLNLKDPESYKLIQQYDLHIFPSRFNQECAPGSVIDMFIAGVPTLSSSFESAKNLMSDENSYFFELGSVEDLEKKLLYIYNHKDELAAKRSASYKEKYKHTASAFIDFLKRNEIIV